MGLSAGYKDTVRACDRDETIGRNSRCLRGPGTEPELTAQLRDGIAARVPVMVELRNCKRDGTPFCNVVPTVAAARSVLGVLTRKTNLDRPRIAAALRQTKKSP